MTLLKAGRPWNFFYPGFASLLDVEKGNALADEGRESGVRRRQFRVADLEEVTN